MLEALKQDIRSACRGLWRARAFTAAATLTLALGITGSTVMFAIVDGVLLRPLPVRDQDRLILAWKELRSSRFAHYPFGGPDVEAVVEPSQLIANRENDTRRIAPFAAHEMPHPVGVRTALQPVAVSPLRRQIEQRRIQSSLARPASRGRVPLTRRPVRSRSSAITGAPGFG